MLDYFSQRKEEITELLVGYARRDAQLGPTFGLFETSPQAVLTEFSARGKMLRGGLVVLGYNLFHEEVPPEVIQAAAAIELVQSGMLIQDDVMDRDRTRRGGQALHVQFEEQARRLRFRSPYHLASSMAVCMGDMAFFHGMALLNGAVTHTPRGSEIIAVFSEEIARVGTAQMADLYYAAMDSEIGAGLIWDIYRNKTGRYSFALPLIIGAHLAEAPLEHVERLGRIGENLGMVFQARDDELGLFGDEAATGKPLGSDLKEGKKTLIWIELQQKLTTSEQAELSTMIGSPKINGRELGRIQELVEKYDVRTEINRELERLSQDARREIDQISGARVAAVSTLQALVGFNLHRNY